MNGYEPAAQPRKRRGPALIKLLALGLLIAVTITAGVVHLIHRVIGKTTEAASAHMPHPRSDDRKGAASTSRGSNASPVAASRSNANPAGAKPAAPYGWTLKDGKLVPASAPGTESSVA